MNLPRKPISLLLGLILSSGLTSTLAVASPQETATAEHYPLTGLPVEDEVVAAIVQEAEQNGQVTTILEELVIGIGPRLTSSKKLTEACQWAADRFEEWGLQNVRLEEWGTFPVGYDRRFWEGRLIQPIKRPITFGFHAWTPGTDGPVRGTVKAGPRNPEELEAMRGTLAGAWVLIGGTPPRFGRDDSSFASTLGNFLDQEGIAGVLRPTRTELIHTGGNHRIDFENLPTRLQLNLHREDAKLMHRLLEEGKPVELEIDIAVQFSPGPVPLYNVIAEIPGSEKPEELVIFGGHLDSWDGARGAQDNGTGSATTMEAARILGKLGVKPKRTIRFMLWSGEEQGLLGSRKYIEQNLEENQRISAVIVHDGGTNALVGIAATPAMEPMFEEVFAPVTTMAAEDGDEETSFAVRPVASLPYGIGSDHDAYLRHGVPGFFWQQSGKAKYSYVHHTQHDTFANAVQNYQHYSAKVVAISAWRLANAEGMVPREGMLQERNSRPRRSLGVFLEDGSVKVRGLVDGGLAKTAGLKKGDVIWKIDDQEIRDQGELRRLLRRSGDRKKVKIRRGEQVLDYWFDWGKKTASQVQ
ncbi:MAG: M20/M25/M40 family metallo-hydrolase [Planctomycetota bacterium]|nr:MAG: M20/M25/M40 family metallo-hydrolase [Planctomycetota bacterium]